MENENSWLLFPHVADMEILLEHLRVKVHVGFGGFWLNVTTDFISIRGTVDKEN